MRKIAPAAVLAVLLAVAPSWADVKIAVANPVKILNELQETKDINKAMEAEQATFKQQVADREQKLKDLQAQRDQLKTDSPQWGDTNKQLVEQRSEAQAWAQQSQIELARKFRDQARRMHDKIVATTTDLAKSKGIDVVLADQQPDVPDSQMEQMNPQQVMNLLFGNNILYHSDALDLTQEVIAKLDAAYKAK